MEEELFDIKRKYYQFYIEYEKFPSLFTELAATIINIIVKEGWELQSIQLEYPMHEPKQIRILTKTNDEIKIGTNFPFIHISCIDRKNLDKMLKALEKHNIIW